jgi:uncharacterized protein (DUF1800 family)
VATNPLLVAHLYRRAGFGATNAQVASLSSQSWSELVTGLVNGLKASDPTGDKVPLPHLTTIPEANTPGYSYNGWDEFESLVTWWIERMVVTDTPLREKLVLLLHNQFPTSWEKVNWAYLMYVQNQLFRTLGPGNFQTLTTAIAQDPSMLIWLDTGTDHLVNPNLNFARELMERFTMGAGNYSETDVEQGARCFTGWQLDYTTGAFYINPYDHDNGTKVFLGHSGNFTGDDVVEIVTHHPASGPWVVSRIWSWLAYPVAPTNPTIVALAKGYAANLDMSSLIEAILNHPDFVSTQALTTLVKQPMEYVVSALRVLGLNTAALPSGSLFWYMGQLGQLPFAPPSVGGWGQNQFWLTTTAANSYLGFAQMLASYANLTKIEDNNGHPAQQIAAVQDLLAIASWSKQTYGALMSLATSLQGDGGSWPAQQLVTLALVSPEFMLN